jgi:hypothetical protein
VTAASEDGKCSVSLDQAANGVILVRMDNGVPGNKALVTTPSGSQFQYNIQPGTWLGLPCNGGSGNYKVMLLENVGGSTFLPLFNETFNVSLSSWLRPYTAASVMMNFGSGSSAVQVSNSLARVFPTTDAKVSASTSGSPPTSRMIRAGVPDRIGAVTTYTPDIEAYHVIPEGHLF